MKNYKKLFNYFLFLNQTSVVGTQKESTQVGTQRDRLNETRMVSMRRLFCFEYPQHILKLMDKKIFTILHSKI